MKHSMLLFMVILTAIELNTPNACSQDTSGVQNNIKTDTGKYALLYVYRQRAFVASLGSYDVHVDDSVVATVKNNSKFIIKLYKEGPTSIWAKTESKRSVTINVKFGHEYFLKCGYSTGMFVMRPQLDLIYPEQGHLDFDAIEEKRSKKDKNN
jgi:hypothetical protein